MDILNVRARKTGIQLMEIKNLDKSAKNVRLKIILFAYGKMVKEKINKIIK